MPPDLPLVPIDDVLIEQVLINLLDNAIKYTPRASPIEIIATATDSAVTVEIADRGPGVPRGEEDKVFEKFYRGQPAAGRGAGLGLAICQGIVEAHGGQHLGPEPARGRRGVPLHAAAGRHATGRRYRPMPDPVVVLIEDEPQIRRFLRATLTGQGYRLFEASTGADGVVEVGSRQPDVIILDLGLPDMDGLDVIRRVREWSGVPIIVLSARGQERDKVAALDAGADDYVTKPFGAGELLARIRVALRHAAGASHEGDDAVFKSGELRVDLLHRQVLVGEKQVHLTPIEYKLLTTLVRHAGKVVTHQQLLREVWGPSHTEQTHYVRVYMAHLRHKLEAEPARPRYLLTEPGVGYRLASE